MVQPIFHFVWGFTKGVTNRGGREKGRLPRRWREHSRSLREDRCMNTSRWSLGHTGSYHPECPTRVWICICTSVCDIRIRRGGGDLGICPSRVSGHTVPRSEYPALKPTITLFESRLSAIPPLRVKIYDSSRKCRVKDCPIFKHF